MFVDSIDTKAPVGGFSRENIVAATGDFVDGIQKLRYLVPERNGSILGCLRMTGDFLMLRNVTTLWNLPQHTRDSDVAVTTVIHGDIIPSKGTYLTSAKSQLHLQQHCVRCDKARTPFEDCKLVIPQKIHLAVMFALHMAASDAPQFLLLDEPLATMDDTQVLNVLDILKSLAEQNTQIFFTTANGIMIDLFRKGFENTPYDYKEYQFIKRVNRPSEIKETSSNNAKGIEELTLDDLTMDFHQFEQIRDILRKNQENKNASNEDETSGKHAADGNNNLPRVNNMNELNEEEEERKAVKEIAAGEEASEKKEEEPYNFFDSLSEEEADLLRILIWDDGKSASQLKSKLSVHPTYKKMLDHINEAAIWYFGEPVVRTDDVLPWARHSYREELRVLSDECSKR